MRKTAPSQPGTRTALVVLLAPLVVAGTFFGEPAAASEELEGEIEAELRRQEELLRSRDFDSQIERARSEQALREESLAERVNPRIAPKAPVIRNLPLAIFESEEIEISPGSWGNREALAVVRRSLDADRDGTPEQIRYFDPITGALIRREADQDYDGTIDSWERYADGSMVERMLDTNNDTRVDVWEKYRAGRMSERTVDRNTDGSKDGFYIFTGDSLVEERHDRDEDGRIDLIVTYRNRQKINSREDRNYSGQIDTWISYEVVGEDEIPNRIERDSDGSGKVDIIEAFVTSSGKPILSQREEDRNGDGEMDVKSIYRGGKLYRREISDPNLVP